MLDPKLDAVEAAGVDYVVAVNPGCLRQWQTGLARRKSRIRAVHLADLLVAAAGGRRAADGAAAGGPAPAGPPAVRAAGAAGVPAPQGRRPRRARTAGAPDRPACE